MKPITTEEIKSGNFIVFSKDGNKFLGWIIKLSAKEWIARPSNNWKKTTFTKKTKPKDI